MVAFVFMTPLQQAQALYVDAYRVAWGCEPKHLSPEKWQDMGYLEASTEGLIEVAMIREQGRQRNAG